MLQSKKSISNINFFKNFKHKFIKLTAVEERKKVEELEVLEGRVEGVLGGRDDDVLGGLDVDTSVDVLGGVDEVEETVVE